MSKENKTKPLKQPAVSSSYMAERMKKIIKQPEPLKEPPYNCPTTGDKRVGNGCSYPNCMCEWYL